MSPETAFGVDPLAERYAQIYDYPSEIIVNKGYGENLPFRDAEFDVVFSSNCIDHTTSPEQTIQEVARVLNPTGILYWRVKSSLRTKGKGTKAIRIH